MNSTASKMKFSMFFVLAALSGLLAVSSPVSAATEEATEAAKDYAEVQFSEYDMIPNYGVASSEGSSPASPSPLRVCVRIRCRIYPKPVICWCIQWA